MANQMRHIFTSESVTEGHPDKMADQISDAVLDAVLAADPSGRVACEVLVTTGIVVISGEITTTTYVDVPRLAREVVRDIGYNDATFGFDCKTCGILNTIQSQSPDIAMGVDTGGAGDQGLMFGYACNETPELMPLPIMLAHNWCAGLSEVRRSGLVDFSARTVRARSALNMSTENPSASTPSWFPPNITTPSQPRGLRDQVKRHVIDAVVSSSMDHSHTRYHINPTGR